MKSKSLTILAIVVALLVGTSYLFFQISGANQPSLSNESPGTPQGNVTAKSPLGQPEHKVPSVIATNPGTQPNTVNAKRSLRHHSGIPAPATDKSQLLYQGFEEGIMPPTGWSVVVNNPYTWHIESYQPYEGTYHAVCFYDQDYTGTQDEWMISPVIDLTTKGSAWHLYFYWYMSYYWGVSPYDNYNIEVWISTDGGSTFSTMLWTEPTATFSDWTYYRADVDLAPYLTESSVKLGFRYYGYDGAEASFDGITVETEPTGRCCYGDPQSPSCADVTPSVCSGLGGTWTEGLNCTNDPCPVAGAGENCASAIPIPSLPYSTTGNTCAFLDDYDETCPYSGGTAPDVVYSYAPASNQAINIVLCNSLYDTKVFVYEDACASGTAIACNDDACGSDTYKSQILGLSLSAGHTYYIVVDGYGTSCGDYDLNVTEAGEAPPNDECTGAPVINTFPDTEYGTTIGATIDCPGVLDWNAVWYQLDLPYTCNNVMIDFCPTSGLSIYQVGVVLYNSCPVSCADYILYNSIAWPTCGSGYVNPQITWRNLAAGSYWFPVAVWDASMNPFLDFGVTFNVEECPPATPGDNCSNPKVIPDLPGALPYSDIGQYTCGRGHDYDYITCLNPFDGGEDMIYQVGVTSACNVDILLDPKASDWSGIAIDVACPPGSPCMVYATNYYATPYGIYSVHLEPGTYYIMVDTWPAPDCIPEFDLTIQEAAPPPANDECTGAPVYNTFPADVYGTTVGATVDCPDVLNWNAVWYEFDVPYTCNNITVDYCLTDWSISQIGIVLYNSCPPNCAAYIVSSGYQWLSCANGTSNPEVWWNDLPGPASYWLPVYPFAMNTFGFTVNVEECVPCDVVCPPGAMQENEPVCYDGYVDNYNGGCNSSPYVWQDITCNTWICGTSGVYDNNGYRDTDWFRVEAADGDLTWKVVAEFPVLIFLMDAGSENCADYTILGSMTAAKCDTAVLSMYVPAGVYWLWVGPSDWGNYPCGVEYVGHLECTGLGPRAEITPGSFYPVLNPTGACSSSTENMSISSVGSEDLTYSVAENPPVDWLEVSPTSGTVPPGNTDVLDVSIDAGGMTPGDYYTDLDITTNAPKGVITVPVHLTVELPAEIDVPPRLWVPVIPGCMQDQKFRINNLGTGQLTFDVDIRKGAKLASKYDVDAMRQKNAENRANSPALSSKADDMNNPAHLSMGGVYTPGTPLQTKGDTLFIQLPMTPDESWSFATSDEGVGYKLYENFWDVTQSITDIHFWGLCLIYSGGWSAGDPNNLVFDISFYSDPPDDPTLPPTDLLCTYTDVVPTWEGTGQYYVGFEMYAFDVADLASSCDMPDGWGWVSIQSKSAGEGYDWFLWASAQTGDGMSCQEGGNCPYYYDDAMILTGGGVACPFTATPDAGTVPAESFFDVMLTFDGSFFDVCGVDTTTCNLIISSNDCDEPEVTVPVYMWAARGDVNADCRIDVLDVVFLLNYVFVGGPAPNPLCVGDVTRNGGNPDSDDALYLISYLFLYGAPPEMPSAPTR
jgi:hypothetical protein